MAGEASKCDRRLSIPDLHDLLGQRWILRLIWALRNGAKTSRSLRAATMISPNILQARLNDLRAADLVELEKQEGYRLTDLGHELASTLAPLQSFAARLSDASHSDIAHSRPMSVNQAIVTSALLEDTAKVTADGFAERVLRYFYPVHYRFGMDMEQAMGQGRLGRKQAALLWLIYSEAGPDGWMPRKDIETTLGAWFEMSPPNVTKIIHDTASAPHEMIEIIESPGSGREKLLRLTSEGKNFVSTMIESAGSFLGGRVRHMSQAKLAAGLAFLEEAFGQETNLPV